MDKEKIQRATVAGVVWKFLERGSSQVVTLLVSIVLARLLSPDEYGIIAMTMIFIALTEVFLKNGIGDALIQQAQYDARSFSTMFYVSLGISGLLYVILYAAAPYFGSLMNSDELPLVLRVLGLRLPFSAMYSIQQAYVSQQMVFRKLFPSTLSSTVVSGFVGLGLAYMGYGVWALVGQNLTAVAVRTASLQLLIPWRPSLVFDGAAFHRLFSFGWRVLVTNVISTVFSEMRGFFIGRFYSPADLAFANQGARFPQLIAGNISTAFSDTLFPAFSHLREDRKQLRGAASAAMTTGGFLVAGLMGVLAGTADSLIHVVLTDKWMACVPYLQCVCILELFAFLSVVNLQTLLGLGRADIVLKLELIKKPVYFLLISIGVMFSPLAIVALHALYSIIGFCMNAVPNRKLIDYHLSDQLRDVLPSIFLALILAGLLQYAQYILPHDLFYLCMEGGGGITLYIALGKLFCLRGAETLCQGAYTRIKNVRHRGDGN